MAFKFENLKIWKEAVKFAGEIYELTKKFPSSEKFALTSQLQRAAVSVSLNIAEGDGRSSDADLSRYLQIAIGSVNEVVTILHISFQQHYIDEQQFEGYYARCETLVKMLHAFKRYLKSDRL